MFVIGVCVSQERRVDPLVSMVTVQHQLWDGLRGATEVLQQPLPPPRSLHTLPFDLAHRTFLAHGTELHLVRLSGCSRQGGQSHYLMC